MIKSGLLGLKIEIGKIPKNEIDIEQPDKIVNILEKILDINNQNQEEQELTMLTRDQMLGWLPITLAQLQAGNNSEKL